MNNFLSPLSLKVGKIYFIVNIIDLTIEKICFENIKHNGDGTIELFGKDNAYLKIFLTKSICHCCDEYHFHYDKYGIICDSNKVKSVIKNHVDKLPNIYNKDYILQKLMNT